MTLLRVDRYRTVRDGTVLLNHGNWGFVGVYRQLLLLDVVFGFWIGGHDDEVQDGKEL